MIGWPLWNAYWHPANSRKSYPGQREAALGHPVIIDVVSGARATRDVAANAEGVSLKSISKSAI
jgi:hypothetical protein